MSTGIFTNNWQGLKNSMLLGGIAKEDVSDAYNVSGTRVYSNGMTSPLKQVYQGFGASSGSYNYVRFGTSDTTPTATDIDLGNVWSSGITYVSVSNSAVSWSGARATREYSVTIQNTAAASVTVREFGIFCYTSNGYALLYRAVLDTPVTIAQYESATITFSVSITISDPI